MISTSRPKEFTRIYNATQLDRFLRVILNENCKKNPDPTRDQNFPVYLLDSGKSNVRYAATV